MTSDDDRFRIGELSRRTGLSEHVLRAWERRYGVLHPERSAGGFRLYSAADEQRVRQMQDALSRGLSPAEAARAATPADAAATSPAGDLTGPPADPVTVTRLVDALEAFDATTARACLDELLGVADLDPVLRDVLLPMLHDLGERWEAGEVSVAQEHFASNLVRSRLATLLVEVPAPAPVALLACPPGELHDLPLLVHAVCLSRRGWRTVFLGADVPMPDLVGTAHSTHPAVVVLAATVPDQITAVAQHLRLLARATTLALGGRGATGDTADEVGALLLDGDPVTEAERLTRLVHDAIPTTGTPAPTDEG